MTNVPQSDSHGLREAIEREIEWLRSQAKLAGQETEEGKPGPCWKAAAHSYAEAADRLTEALSSHPVQSESDDAERLAEEYKAGWEAGQKDAEARLKRVREWGKAQIQARPAIPLDALWDILDLTSDSPSGPAKCSCSPVNVGGDPHDPDCPFHNPVDTEES